MAPPTPCAATAVRGGVAWIVALTLAATAPGTATVAAEMAAAKHILRMAGCFSVTYRFFEDGAHDYFSEQYGLDEPMTLVNEITSRGQRSITITNYAVVGDGKRIPHWHQVWVYLEEAGRWRQSVWSRAQSSENREFRYACEGNWERNRWVCDAGRAPKPFRDDGAPFGFLRNDYDVLDRDNTFLVTPEGWVMTQQNRKLKENGDLVSYETGFILYHKQSDAACDQ